MAILLLRPTIIGRARHPRGSRRLPAPDEGLVPRRLSERQGGTTRFLGLDFPVGFVLPKRPRGGSHLLRL
jgi:hypothetical protein